MHSTAVRKRPELQDANDLNKDDDVPGKRVKPTPNLKEDMKSNNGNSSKPTTTKQNVDNGPVQQLIAMFSSLVAQGEQSAAMLEILISSISADLLAQVVMANMPNLPLVCPKEDGEKESLNTGSHPAAQSNNLSAYLTDIILKSTNSQVTHSAPDTPIDEVCSYYLVTLVHNFTILLYVIVV